jgi:DNA-binding SARP family transcriptional activator
VLRARLLGALEVELDGAAIDCPASQRPWALFACMALAPDGVSRAELANRFWPDVLDQSARASLRSALWALRRRLGERLVVEGERVSLKDSGGVWVDVREFERLAASGEPEAALSLCRGELLEGVEAEWALAARERHRERVIELLEGLAGAAEGSGDARRAIEFTRRQVERDPFDEEAHRLLMRRLADAGDRAGALRAYRALSERLARELGSHRPRRRGRSRMPCGRERRQRFVRLRRLPRPGCCRWLAGTPSSPSSSGPGEPPALPR